MYKSMLTPSELCVPAGMLGLTAPWLGMAPSGGDVWFFAFTAKGQHETNFLTLEPPMKTFTSSSILTVFSCTAQRQGARIFQHGFASRAGGVVKRPGFATS
jgi:hypothetical protein